MPIKVLKVKKLSGQGSLRGFADVEINDVIVKGVRILEGKNGMFIALPQTKGKDEKWYPIVAVKTDELFNELREVVLNHYGGGGGQDFSQGDLKPPPDI